MWSNSIPIYIDPTLKAHDKAFVSYLDKLSSSHNFRPVDILSGEGYTSDLPIIIVLYNTNEAIKQVDECKDIVIQYQKENLDLLGSSLQISNLFEVEGIDELESFWPLISDYLSTLLNELENQMIVSAAKDFNTVSGKKNLAAIKANFDRDVSQEFRRGLVAQPSLTDISKYTSEFFLREFNFEVGIYSVGEIINSDRELLLLPFPKFQGHTLFLGWEGEIVDILLYYMFIEDFLSNLANLEVLKEDVANWEDIKNTIEIPVLLLDGDRNILTHNRAFIDLDFSVKNCTGLENNQQISIKKKLYRVILNKDDEMNISYIFFPVDELLANSKNPSSEELGIISSSIAHELNNPLAGIMAALDYLLLEIEDEKICESITDMKAGVFRCKKLVETFLGFSRYKTLEGNNLVSHFQLRNSMQQALELMRFRLIENNFSLNLEFKNEENFLAKKNPYVFSMIFYLILGEVVTAFSHLNLVQREKMNNIHLGVLEYPFHLEVMFPEKIVFFENVLKSKLIKHLCEIEQISLKLADKNTLKITSLAKGD